MVGFPDLFISCLFRNRVSLGCPDYLEFTLRPALALQHFCLRLLGRLEYKPIYHEAHLLPTPKKAVSLPTAPVVAHSGHGQ